MNTNELINKYMKENNCSRSTAFRKFKRGELTLNDTNSEGIDTNQSQSDTKSVSKGDTSVKNDTNSDTNDTTPKFVPNWKTAGYKSKDEAIAEILSQVAKVAGNSQLMLGHHILDVKKLSKA